MDLHLHTPGSSDYQQPDISYLDILRQAEARGLDIIAFTDHNTIQGYASMLEDVERLEYLEKLDRIQPEEKRALGEYRRLLDKILVLPGFEFTATFGFHILGIFSPDTPIRQLEHLLLSLNIPLETLEEGSSVVGASADVLTCYQVVRQAGGIVIAAHANSSHGVAMRGMDFGGQTRIAYTQDPNLHALEVTDLEKRGRYTTMRFFDGSKPGYPRPMRCIQGSDAHRLTAGSQKQKDLGIGDRITEILLPECTFEAIKEVFESRDFALCRPYRSSRDPFDHIQSTREEGESMVQSFHPSMTRKGGHLYAIISDVCAFANTNGGTVYVGISADPKEEPVGVTRVSQAIDTLYSEIDKRISPKVDVDIDSQNTRKKTVIRVRVSHGDNVPYAIDDNKIYIRDESETTTAVRDEIVHLVKQGSTPPPRGETTSDSGELSQDAKKDEKVKEPAIVAETRKDAPPLTGVEVVGTEKRRGTLYHMMRDLRNGNIIHNVTRSSARRLWHYAIMETENKTFKPSQVDWRGDVGLVKSYKKAGAMRYDLVQKTDNAKNKYRLYYGVTEDGMHGQWAQFIQEEDDAND